MKDLGEEFVGETGGTLFVLNGEDIASSRGNENDPQSLKQV